MIAIEDQLRKDSAAITVKAATYIDNMNELQTRRNKDKTIIGVLKSVEAFLSYAYRSDKEFNDNLISAFNKSQDDVTIRIVENKIKVQINEQ